MTKIKITDYDSYLLTNKNTSTFVGKLEAMKYNGFIYLDGNDMIINIDGIVPDEIIKYCGEFWEGKAIRVSAPINKEDIMVEAIDDIFIADEIAGTDDKFYRKLVKAVIKRMEGV